MKTLFALAAAGLASAAAPLLAKPADDGGLDRLLAGRIAGAAVSCISLSQARSSTVIDGTAIVYRIGSTLYVNRPRSGAEGLDDGDTLVTRTPSTRLCSGDPVRTRDPHSGIYRGSVILGEFVPYRRAG